MNRKFAAILAVLSGLLIFPHVAAARQPRCVHHHGDSRSLCVRVDNRGRGSTNVEVNKTTIGGLPAAQVIATPDENRPVGPLDISVNAQVAVLQVVVRTADPAILDGANVGITQGNGGAAPGGAQPADGGSPPTTADPKGPPAPAGGSGITINVNAQVAVVQVVIGTTNAVVLKNVDVTINQGNQGAAGA